MSATANFFSMPDLNRKRKHEAGEPTAHCDADSDSDLACVAPDSEYSSNASHIVKKHKPVRKSRDTESSIKQERVCVDGTSTANGSNVTANLPSATRPSSSSLTTKDLPAPLHPQNSTATDQDMERDRRIWICGHSFIRRAAIRYREGEFSQQAKEKGVQLHWIGEDDLRLDNIRTLISHACADELLPHPDVIVIHVGGDDMRFGRMFVRDSLLSLFSWIRSLIPEVIILWSEMLPRMQWGFGQSSRAINVSARRLNSELRKVLTDQKLGVITHNLISGATMFGDDGVHLSDLGFDTFIGSILNSPMLLQNGGAVVTSL